MRKKDSTARSPSGGLVFSRLFSTKVLGNYPLTVGTVFPENVGQTVTVRNGRFRIEREYDPSVRVPEVVLKCVGFIGEGAFTDSVGVSGDLLATGFFVSIPAASPELVGMRSAYFVTAKHVASDLAGREAYILVNKKGGGITTIKSIYGNWWLHPTDKTADVAVVQIYQQADADIDAVGIEHFGIPQMLTQLGIGIGDEVHMTGLFTPAPGTSQNMPILRHGNIAMIPSEQIQTDLGYADVYLVEARSIGGLSGSPVFVRPTINTRLPAEQQHGTVKNSFSVGHGATLLGLMHGHWDIKESEMNKATIEHDRKRGVNLGIGIVVPAQKIFEVLMRPELAAIRDESEKKLLKRSVPGTDSARPSKKIEERTFTAEDFNAALEKVSRKIPHKK